jgi:nucleoid-associated protein YgaU
MEDERMGKKKDKKAAKAARAAGATNRPTGFALPDELLKQGAALLEKANSPAGREMIAAGLTMAAAAASAALVKRGVDKAAEATAAAEPAKPANPTKPAEPAKPAAARPATEASNDQPVLVDTLNQAADALLKRFLGPKAG